MGNENISGIVSVIIFLGLLVAFALFVSLIIGKIYRGLVPKPNHPSAKSESMGTLKKELANLLTRFGKAPSNRKQQSKINESPDAGSQIDPTKKVRRLTANCPRCDKKLTLRISQRHNKEEIRKICCPNCHASFKIRIKSKEKERADEKHLEESLPPSRQKIKIDFRVPNEKITLCISLACLAFFLFLILQLDIYIFLAIVCISVAVVKLRQGQFLGDTVKVSEKQFVEVYKAGKIVSQRLSLKMPDIFVRQDPVINAFAIGFFGKKSVVLNSKTVECMNGDELIAILGHEFSHIRCNVSVRPTHLLAGKIP